MKVTMRAHYCHKSGSWLLLGRKTPTNKTSTQILPMVHHLFFYNQINLCSSYLICCDSGGVKWDWLSGIYVLSTINFISGRVATYDSVHSAQLCSAAPLRDQATSTMIRYPTQSRYPDTGPNGPWHILIMLNTSLGRNNYRFLSHRFDSISGRVSGSQNGRRTLSSFGHPSGAEMRCDRWEQRNLIRLLI